MVHLISMILLVAAAVIFWNASGGESVFFALMAFAFLLPLCK